MNILLASTSSGSRGGGELFLLHLGRALAARGHHVTLWASTHPRMDELALKFARIGTVLRAPYSNTYDLPGRSLTAWLRRSDARPLVAGWRKFDVVHLNKQNLEDGLDLLHAASKLDTPVVCTIHLTQSATYLRARFAPLRDRIARHALNAFPGPLVAVVEDRARDLAAFLRDPSPRIRAIPNGVPIPPPRAEPRPDTARLHVVAVGRMVPQKRPLLFLELARAIHSRFPDSEFTWVGDGTLSGEWDRTVNLWGLGGIIRRVPWQPDVHSFLANADLFLHTAEYEGLALALLEAMAAGLPIAVKANLLTDMPFLTGETAIPIPDGDSAWIEALGDRTRLRRLGAGARALAEEQFSSDTMARRYESLYRETLEQARPREEARSGPRHIP